MRTGYITSTDMKQAAELEEAYQLMDKLDTTDFESPKAEAEAKHGFEQVGCHLGGRVSDTSIWRTRPSGHSCFMTIPASRCGRRLETFSSTTVSRKL